MRTLFKHKTPVQKDFERLSKRIRVLNSKLVSANVTKVVESGNGNGDPLPKVETPLATLYEVTTAGYEVEAHITTVLCNYASATSIALKNGRDYNDNKISIKKIGLGDVTITSAGGDTIDSETSAIITNQFDSITLEFYNKNWNIV